MNEPLTEAQIIQMITFIVEKHGCTIRELSLDNYYIDITGSDEGQVACAAELAAFLNFEEG
ncbi:MAG: hypothetical protein CR990_00030 [Desulfococcus sp.]|nr:MAG: hypothetical protein CR990_00030 [Desulfococcus sp.]